MALTPEGTPYVESSDLVANYPAASLSLANRVDLVGVLPFATSTARATAIPSPTDGQYSYLQDTNSTEYWNGSAWIQAAILPGLNIVSPTSIANSGGSASASGGAVTFTGVTSISLNGVFTSTYDNYLIKIVGTLNSGAITYFMRARNAGTDVTGATEYGSSANYITDVQAPTRQTVNNSYWQIGSIGDLTSAGAIDIYGPALSNRTVVLGNAYQRNASDLRLDVFGGHRVTAASHDGFTIYTGSGTITGTIRVYGYKNS